MTTISREIEIQASEQDVWNAISNFGDICHASPGVSSSHVTSDSREGVGATRHCDFTMMGASAEEIITSWEEGKSLSIEVYEFNKLPGIKSMTADFSLRTEKDKTILKADLSYVMKNGFFNVMNALFMKRMNAKNWNGVLAGHKKYIETGERVDEKTALNLAQVVQLH
jgi:carbon monoxide dehydrogenase subunit G